MSNILVYAEIEDGVVHDVSLQCLAKGREIADASSGKVDCLAVGSGIRAAAEGLGAFGAEAVFVAEDAKLEQYLTSPFKKVVSDFLKTNSYDLILFPATTVGDDLAPAVAEALGVACVLHCDGLAGDALTRLEFDRKVSTTYKAEGCTIASLKDGIAVAGAPDSSRSAQVSDVAVELDAASTKSKVLRRDVAKKTVNLKDAKIIVAGGAGVGTKENFSLIEELADALGAQIGATRAVVDAGWLPADHQIGQTGVTVRPAVYIACGISGAVQHRVGMLDSGKIIAINTDKNAPIFKIAHYKIEGDLKEVLPKLVKLIKA
ncbi:MAG: electron transfer flavoprotein subunit alpha/FixB family protein [Verrucomicrobia bacterium]|nr:electron transfer flavoprotein subunit alpha/FixB family protein [Verrucomicrobiota bacterium]